MYHFIWTRGCPINVSIEKNNTKKLWYSKFCLLSLHLQCQPAVMRSLSWKFMVFYYLCFSTMISSSCTCSTFLRYLTCLCVTCCWQLRSNSNGTAFSQNDTHLSTRLVVKTWPLNGDKLGKCNVHFPLNLSEDLTWTFNRRHLNVTPMREQLLLVSFIVPC